MSECDHIIGCEHQCCNEVILIKKNQNYEHEIYSLFNFCPDCGQKLKGETDA